MNINVHLHQLLQRPTPDGWQRSLDVTLLSGSTLHDLVNDLGLALPIDAMTMEVNGMLVDPTHILQDGDQVHLKSAA